MSDMTFKTDVQVLDEMNGCVLLHIHLFSSTRFMWRKTGKPSMSHTPNIYACGSHCVNAWYHSIKCEIHPPSG